MLTHMHPDHAWFACKTSSSIKGSGGPSAESGPVPEPPSTQSRFARLGGYLRRQDVEHLVRGRYPSFLAPIGSCARPTSSVRRRFSYFGRSLQVAVSPCWTMVLPDVISTVCVKALGPIPRRVPVVLFVCGNHRTSASPQGRIGLGTRNNPCNATSTGGSISGLQSFANVQAPLLARPPGCTNRCARHRAARPFTSRNEHVVTRLDGSRFYMNRDIATYPKRTNSYDGTFTRRTVALSAATPPPSP